MRIIYFTTAQDNNEFSSISTENKKKINSSNQVFHSNFIKALAVNNEIDVYSCRSYANQLNKSSVNVEENVSWNYLRTKKNKISTLLSQVKEINKINSLAKIAFVDTMNLRCLLIAKKYCKKNHIPLVGIVTDNPFNITNLKKSRAKLLIKLSSKCTGYVCLTEDLNLFYNKNNKPSILLKGISKPANNEIKSNVDYPYFFYAGTLLKQYGILDLISAFNELNDSNTKLIISGHHYNKEFETAIKDHHNIIYIGNIANEEVLNYENNSIANINPRPYIEQIDKYSIPSKVIEYSSKGSMVISGISTSLQKDFMGSILWIDENNSLSSRLKEAIEMNYKVRAAIIKNMNAIAENNFSLNVANQVLNDFIEKVTKDE